MKMKKKIGLMRPPPYARATFASRGWYFNPRSDVSDPDLQLADQAVRGKVELGRALLAAQGPLDHLRAEALFLRRFDLGTAGLGPAQGELATIAVKQKRPVHPHRAGFGGKRTVFHRIGAELMDNHHEQQSNRWIETHIRPVHRETQTVALLEWYERSRDNFANIAAGPVLLRQEVVGVGERVQARRKRRALFLGCRAEGLSRDRLHGAKRVLDPVLDFIEQQFSRRLGLLALGNVAGDFRGADDAPFRFPDRRQGQRDVYLRAVLALANGLIVLNAVASPNALENAGFLVLPLGGDQDQHGLADDFLGSIAEQALGAPVPARDDTVEILADDCIVRRSDNGCEIERCIRNSRSRRLGRHRGGQMFLFL